MAKVIEEKSMAKTFQGTVKQVLGTCLSLGCTVDKQNPKQVIAKINNGEIKVWKWFYYLKYEIQNNPSKWFSNHLLKLKTFHKLFVSMHILC